MTLRLRTMSRTAERSLTCRRSRDSSPRRSRAWSPCTRWGSCQTLLIRPRREALLRIVEAASQQGYNAVCNVRFETADVGGISTMRKVAMVAIVASATAYHAAPPAL